MTKKQSRKSTTRKKTSTSRKKKTTSTRRKTTAKKSGRGLGKVKTGGAAAIIITILALAYFIYSGNDPLSIFTGEDELGDTSNNIGQVINASSPGTGGDWWQVYFTDPNTINDPENLSGSIPEQLIELIDNATTSIHIASFEFNLTPVAEALIDAHRRGVDVRWVTDDEHGLEADEEEGHGQFALLQEAGIDVIDDGRSALMHDKFWIFDSQTVWTGSTNITKNGNFRNNNNVIIIESPELAAIYEQEFLEMWESGEFGPRSSSTVGQQSTTIDGTPIQVLFAAEDDVAPKLADIISQAESSIYFMAFSFTHDDMGDAVMAGVEAGLDVRGIFETRGSETEFSELPLLFCRNAAVRQDGNPGTFHHKVFLIDEQIVVTGSFNFSNNANESNDENVLIISNTDIAAAYLAEFERRWAEAEAPDPADMNC